MNSSQALRLTPSNSPFFRNGTPKSPTKASKSEEAALKLKKVIGTTTANANGFDFLPSARQFAYTAGAAAVVSTMADDLNVSQRFFRARPTASATRDGSWPISPTPDLRNKAIGNLRDQNANASPLSSSLRDWTDSPTGKSLTAKDRVKAATSVALSPNGKWVAVGESGYKPRILIFSNSGESSEIPVCALSEHTFGVHALTFSPDSKYLASLGTVNDGFLYIWDVDDRTGLATLHSSNKCTSTINVMTWLGRSVLTIGLRYIKLWKPDEQGNAENSSPGSFGNMLTAKLKASDFGKSVLSPRHKVLAGKNSLLKELLDANFVAVVPFDSRKAIICAESGEICLLDDSEAAQTLTAMGQVGFRITAAMIDDSKTLHVIGNQDQVKRFNVPEILQRAPTTPKRDRRSTISPFRSMSTSTEVTTTAIAKIGYVTVELDSKRGLRLTKSGDASDIDAEFASHQLVAHSDAVLGVKCVKYGKLPDAAFLTFSGDGTVHIWDIRGKAVTSFHIPIKMSAELYDTSNELRAVAQLEVGPYLAAGDKYGSLSVLDISTGSLLSQVRAHATEIIELTTFMRQGVQLIATASRDRMVQLFAWREDKIELLQTMDEHAAAVTALTVASYGDMLLSCSTDRTIVIREAMLRNDDDPASVVFVFCRTITLKSAPLSMCLGADQEELLVSTTDRTICKYNIRNGQTGFSFKCSDSEGGEAASMSKILYAPSLSGNPTIIGVSSGDKSVRLYSDYGSLVARDWGHTEGITDIALLTSSTNSDADFAPQIVTVAADSTIFMWDTTSAIPKDLSSTADELSDTANKLTPLAPPLRKVISYTELTRFKHEKSTDGEDTTSPITISTPTQPTPLSPRRIKKKTSRTSVLQPPRLEPAFRTNRRESSARRRSPSPPSPKGKKDLPRKPSLGMSLRSKSSENVLSSYASSAGIAPGFGSVASSTESVCRNLRAYRKKLASASTDAVSANLLRELGTELKLTARVLGEKVAGADKKVVDEVTLAKLLDQAGDRIMERLEERIKSEGGLSRSVSGNVVGKEEGGDVEAVAGALGKVRLE